MTQRFTRLSYEKRGHVTLIGLSREDKLNAFDVAMLNELGLAMRAYEDDEEARCALLFAHGKSFTAGLDLAEVGPHVKGGGGLFEEGIDPLSLHGRKRQKPLVTVVQGHCLTIGIELLLASDIGIAEDTAVFGQIEINRGIFPFGGATLRLPLLAGWGNAMRWLLTGDRFDAREAHRIGLVQEVTPSGEGLAVGLRIAETVAKRAPLGVRATLESARLSVLEGQEAAVDALLPVARRLMNSKDAEEGLRSFVERREAEFTGE